jgi:hypothetical protein
MRFVQIVSALLFFVANSGGAVMADDLFEKAEGRWVSEWQTSHGGTETTKTTFDEYGRMSSVPGPWVTFYAADDAGLWQGYWTSDSSPQRCPTEKEGRRHWGVVEFQFDEAYQEFEGTWDFCGEGQKWAWKGKRGNW